MTRGEQNVVGNLNLISQIATPFLGFVGAWFGSFLALRNAKSIEAIKAENEHLRDKKKELLRLRDALREHQRAWASANSLAACDSEDAERDLVLPLCDELQRFLQELRDHRLYLNKEHLGQLESAIDSCRAVLHEAAEIAAFQPVDWSVGGQDMEFARKISEANSTVVKLADEIINHSLEDTVAHFGQWGDRERNEPGWRRS